MFATSQLDYIDPRMFKKMQMEDEAKLWHQRVKNGHPKAFEFYTSKRRIVTKSKPPRAPKFLLCFASKTCPLSMKSLLGPLKCMKMAPGRMRSTKKERRCIMNLKPVQCKAQA